MRSWNLSEIETPGGSRSPLVLHSEDELRAVLIGLDPGQELGDHSVRENAYLVVVDGSVRIEGDGESLVAGPGTYVTFAAGERRAVSAEDRARILLLLAPWPGEGHYRAEERALGRSSPT